MQLGGFDESLMPIYVFGRHLVIAENNLKPAVHKLGCVAIEHWILDMVTLRFDVADLIGFLLCFSQ